MNEWWMMDEWIGGWVDRWINGVGDEWMESAQLRVRP